jgi:hypothetical protein
MAFPLPSYTGKNINLIPPQIYTRIGIDYDENALMPEPGIIKLRPLVAQQPKKTVVQDYSYNTPDEGGLDVGYE